MLGWSNTSPPATIWKLMRAKRRATLTRVCPAFLPCSRHFVASASGDGAGVGVVLDGSHLARIIGGADDVDAGAGHQPDVGGPDQEFGALPFDVQDFLGFAVAVVVEGQGDLV